MKIGLIDVDGHNFPNLPLMKLSAYHKARGDTVEWYEPMWSGHCDIVYMSKVFSFTLDYQYHIEADRIVKGGSGYCIEVVNGQEIYHPEHEHSLPPEIEHIYPDYSLYPELTKETAPRRTRLLQRWVNNKKIFRTVERFEDYDECKA